MTIAWKPLLAAIATAAMCGVNAPSQAADAGASALLNEYAQRKTALARSPFKRLLLLEADAVPERPRGDVFAVLDLHPGSLALERGDRRVRRERLERLGRPRGLALEIGGGRDIRGRLLRRQRHAQQH